MAITYSTIFTLFQDEVSGFNKCDHPDQHLNDVQHIKRSTHYY